MPSLTAVVRLAPTDFTALPPRLTTSARNAARSECAMTTPIWGQDWTTTPPEAATAFSTSLVWPGLATLALTT